MKKKIALLKLFNTSAFFYNFLKKNKKKTYRDKNSNHQSKLEETKIKNFIKKMRKIIFNKIKKNSLFFEKKFCSMIFVC